MLRGQPSCAWGGLKRPLFIPAPQLLPQEIGIRMSWRLAVGGLLVAPIVGKSSGRALPGNFTGRMAPNTPNLARASTDPSVRISRRGPRVAPLTQTFAQVSCSETGRLLPSRRGDRSSAHPPTIGGGYSLMLVILSRTQVLRETAIYGMLPVPCQPSLCSTSSLLSVMLSGAGGWVDTACYVLRSGQCITSEVHCLPVLFGIKS